MSHGNLYTNKDLVEQVKRGCLVSCLKEVESLVDRNSVKT